MKRILYLCCLLTLAACTNKKQETAQTYPTTPTGLQGIQQPTTTPANSTAGNNSGATNPAHGQPGHRCDLPVGAPLAAKSAQSSVTPQAIANPATTPATVPVSNSKGQRLNPAHGMPGHKCELPVGAPLS